MEATTTLRQVLEKAKSDTRFFADLMDNLEDALARAGLTLSSEDMTDLRNLRRQLIEWSVGDIANFLQKLSKPFYKALGVTKATVPWPG